MTLRHPLHEVLCYRDKPRNRATVRRYYAEHRRKQGLPDRCDNPDCQFHTQPLVWNGKPVLLELDHVNGNSLDNHAKNLRYLCPNCHRQTDTHGGGNIGRVQKVSEGGYELHNKKTGRRDANVFPKGADVLALTGHPPKVKVTSDDD